MDGKIKVERIVVTDDETRKRIVDLRDELIDIAKREFEHLSQENIDSSTVLGTICSVFLNVGVSIQFAVRFSELKSNQQIADETNATVRALCDEIAKRMKEFEA